MTDEWVQLNQEYHILLAKKQSAGRLPPHEEKRLHFLEERLGDYQVERRINISETRDTGPKTVTSQDHYATEVSQQILQDAQAYQPIKAWEKEDPRLMKKAIEIQDRREGRETFQQQGLSPFAVELTKDLKSGEASIAEVPQEETESDLDAAHFRSPAATSASMSLSLAVFRFATTLSMSPWFWTTLHPATADCAAGR